jgi:hypothetical protein
MSSCLLHLVWAYLRVLVMNCVRVVVKLNAMNAVQNPEVRKLFGCLLSLYNRGEIYCDCAMYMKYIDIKEESVKNDKVQDTQ